MSAEADKRAIEARLAVRGRSFEEALAEASARFCRAWPAAPGSS